MVRVLRQGGVWPRTWGPDEAKNRAELARKPKREAELQPIPRDWIDKTAAEEYPRGFAPGYEDQLERARSPKLAPFFTQFRLVSADGRVELIPGRKLEHGTVALVDKAAQTITLATSIYAPMTANALELLDAEYAGYKVIANDEDLGTLGEVVAGLEEVEHESSTPPPAWSGKPPSVDRYKYRVLRRATEQPYYHATRASRLRRIMEEGLRGSTALRQEQGEEGWTQLNPSLQDATYLTASYDYAYAIAETLVARYGEPAVILGVDISGFPLDKLVVDEDVSDVPWYEHKAPGYLQSVAAQSLQSLGVLGGVPPDRLELIEEVVEESEDVDGDREASGGVGGVGPLDLDENDFGSDGMGGRVDRSVPRPPAREEMLY
jgi:hypothetical protein